MKICLIRLDKIGDLVCTLPVDEVPWLQGSQIRWVIAQGLGFVTSHAQPGRRFLQLNKNNKWESFLTLRRHLREEKFQAAVSFQAPWWVSLALWLEGVPIRAGVQSQWHSFLFFNRPLRQRRSRAEKHESDYNLDLLAHALKKSSAEIPLQQISLNKEVTLSSEKDIWLESRAPLLRLRAPDQPDFWDRLGLQKNSYVVVHPGMAGSALNWPQKNYVTLIRQLVDQVQVVITGTPADEPWLREIRAGLEGTSRLRWLVGEVTANELLAVLEGSKLVIAPSTGVAHLATSLGRSVICLFSPVRVQKAIRWSPRGKSVFCFTPAGESADAPSPECMNKISPDKIFSEARRLL